MATCNSARSGALLSTGQVCKRFNCHANSLRRWADSGEIPVVVLPSGHRRFRESDCLQFFYGLLPEDIEKKNTGRKVALLARVSSSKQGKGFDTSSGHSRNGEASDLSRQVARLRAYAKEHYGTEGTLYADIGSGLSFTRKSFLRLIDDVLAGKYRGGVILITYPERMARWGRELIERVCTAFDCEIVAIEDGEEKTPEQELVSDMLALTTIFSAKLHGARAAKTLKRDVDPETISEAVRLRKAGYPVAHIVDVLREQGHRDTKGRIISRYVIDKYLDANGTEKVLSAVVGNGQVNSFEQFHDERIQRVEERIDERTGKVAKAARLPKAKLYEAYLKWCSKRRVQKPVTARYAGTLLKHKYGYQTKYNHTGRVVYCGIGLK